MKEKFWRLNQLPVNIADHLPQPSDDVRHQQYLDYLRSREPLRFPVERTRQVDNVTSAEEFERRRQRKEVNHEI